MLYYTQETRIRVNERGLKMDIDAKVIFDNAGGITLQLGEWAHYYQDPKQAARDYNDYLQDGNTDGWDGHEDESLEIDPTYDQIRNGGCRVYGADDISEATEGDEHNSWGNINDFIAALKEINDLGKS